MGLSFSAFRKELSSERFKRAYERLRAICPDLIPYNEPSALIAFFHDQTTNPDRKDGILFELITHYRKDSRHRDIAPLFIVLFTPALANIHAYNRRKYIAIDGEDLFQDICFLFIQIIQGSEIIPYKVASRVVGELRNRVRNLLNQSPMEEFVGLTGDGHDEFEARQANPLRGDYDENKAEKVVTEITAFLDHLVRKRKITVQDKQIIVDTFIGNKSLQDALPARDYDRLKHRRLKIIALIRNHLRHVPEIIR